MLGGFGIVFKSPNTNEINFNQIWNNSLNDE